MKKFILFLILLFAAVACAQQTPNFQTVAERRLKDKFNTKLSKVCDLQDVVAERVFREYGAIFVGNDVRVPGNCVFDNEASVYAFQAAALPEVANVGGVTVTLQKPAMAEYLAARRDAHKKGLDITPRGGSTASARSYATMLDLWRSRFDPALAYYVKRRSISPAEASAARSAPTREQVAMVLEWEKKGLYFSKDLSKSILYSVAVPGASQHGFLLALDVEQFANKKVRDIMAAHGWFQTVKSDMPHFTYLGLAEKDLASHGLANVTVGGQSFWIPNM